MKWTIRKEKQEKKQNLMSKNIAKKCKCKCMKY